MTRWSAMAALAVVLMLVACLAPTEGFGWWGNTVPVERIVEEGVEKMHEHLTQFFDSFGRVLAARQKRESFEAREGDGAEPDAPNSRFLVEHVFQATAARPPPLQKRQGLNCNEPFGYAHPACSPSYACFISKMECDGTEVNPKTYNGTLDGCTVEQVRCSGGPTPSLSAKNECIPHEFMCDGKHVSADKVPPGAAASCSVYQLQCNNTLLDFGATSKCDRKRHCAAVCYEAGSVCSCSLDRMGPHCATWRPYTCSFRLLNPVPHCQPVPGVDEDPVCFVYRRKQTVKFEYMIDCAFNDPLDPLNPPADDTTNHTFAYFMRSNKFAVSEAQTQLWPFRAQLKVFDFKWLSDLTASQAVVLSPEQLAGNASVSLDLNFEQIPDRFFAGNRLYFEFGLTRESAVLGRTIKFDRRFVDFEGLHIPRSNHSGLSAVEISWVIALSIIGFFVLMLVGYWAKNKFIAWHRPKAHDY